MYDVYDVCVYRINMIWIYECIEYDIDYEYE